MGDIENAVGSNYNDKLRGNLFNNSLDGGGGVDIAYFTGTHADYKITINNVSTKSVIDGIQNRDGQDTLINIERIGFSNGNIAYDIDGNAGQAYRIYQAAFDRKPDLAGLGGWIAELDKGTALQTVAKGFINSAEFQALYGSSPSNATFVDALYLNVLHRPGEKAGVDGWISSLNNGMSKEQVLVGFSESPENQKNVIGSIQNGIEYKEWLG